MPELPEVTIISRGLQPIINQKIVAAISSNTPLREPIPPYLEDKLIGNIVCNIERIGKYIVLHMESKDSLIIHLGMAGRIYLGDNKNPPKHTHLQMIFANEQRFYFSDPRKFGLLDICQSNSIATHSYLKSMGYDALKVTANEAFELFGNLKAAIKPALLDQHKIAGLGNIYACEALWASGISPYLPAKDIDFAKWQVLIGHIQSILAQAIKLGGSTLKDYQHTDGEKGGFQNMFKVYGREDQPCYVCKTPIALAIQASRSTFFCPTCQLNLEPV